MTSGYLHPQYAESLAEFGTPYYLPGCGGWLLRRETDGSAYHDALGCYPLFACRDWSQLHRDLQDAEGDLVSITLVTDPFGDYDEDRLRRCFPQLVRPFKKHFIVDLSQPVKTVVSKHHRYYARKALHSIDVEKCDQPAQFIDEWHSLYDVLIQKHAISGLRAFSKRAFAVQLTVPGIIVFRAMHQGATVAAHLWYVQGQTAYSHLAASNCSGYAQMAAYALYWFAIEYFAEANLRWLDLGAGAGLKDSSEGLSFFKQGWSNDVRTAYLCGRIFDHSKYDELTRHSGAPATSYFPAYRHGEFSSL